MARHAHHGRQREPSRLQLLRVDFQYRKRGAELLEFDENEFDPHLPVVRSESVGHALRGYHRDLRAAASYGDGVRRPRLGPGGQQRSARRHHQRPRLDGRQLLQRNQNGARNWFDWEIGVPLNLNDITVLLYDNLTSAQIANYMDAVNHFTPTPDLTGANKVWKASVVAVRGAIVKSSDKLASARQALSDVFPYV